MVNICGHDGIGFGYLRQLRGMEQIRHDDKYLLQEGFAPKGCDVAWSLIDRYVLQLFHSCGL